MLTRIKGKECIKVIDTIYEGIAEKSKQKITDELRRFIQVENEEAVKIWDLEMYKETAKIVRPQFDLETYLNARPDEEQMSLQCGQRRKGQRWPSLT